MQYCEYSGICFTKVAKDTGIVGSILSNKAQQPISSSLHRTLSEVILFDLSLCGI